MAFYDYDLTEQVKGKHELSKIEEVVGFSGLVYRFKDLANSVGRQGYGVEVGIKALYLQFHYDLSDRELEERLRFDLAFKWFCGFTAFGETPDHRFFGRFRKAMGTKRIGVLFKAINRRAEENGLLKKTFRFADATAIETKQTTWEERDKALANGEEAVSAPRTPYYGTKNPGHKMKLKSEEESSYEKRRARKYVVLGGRICVLAIRRIAPTGVLSGRWIQPVSIQEWDICRQETGINLQCKG